MDFQDTGILGLDEILGGQGGPDGLIRGRPRGERILIVGPPGSGKTLLALSLLYKALIKQGAEDEHGLFLTTEQPAAYLRDAISSGLFMDLQKLLKPSRIRLGIQDFPPYDPPLEPPSDDRKLIDSMLTRLGSMMAEGVPRWRHIVVDGLTALQAVLSSRAEARRLTHLLLARLSWPKNLFDLFVMTSEVHGQGGFGDGFDDYLFDTVISLNVIETPADRRLRTIEITKTRGRHARTGRHSFSIVNQEGLPSLIRSEAARSEITRYGTPIVIFPREPRKERPIENLLMQYAEAEYLKTGIDGLDRLLHREKCGGLLKQSITMLIGGPGTAAGLVGLRYLVKGIEEDASQPVLLVSFGRNREDFAPLSHSFPWLKAVMENSTNAFHVLYYRPVNLDQNRLFYEMRKEIETYHIDRVVIDPLSSLPLVDMGTESSSDFLVTLIGLVKELRCTVMLSYSWDQSPNPLAVPGKFITSLVDNIFVLRNEYSVEINMEMQKRLFILKARGTNAISQEAELSIGEELAIIPLASKKVTGHDEGVTPHP